VSLRELESAAVAHARTTSLRELESAAVAHAKNDVSVIASFNAETRSMLMTNAEKVRQRVT
jgi:hypothetical protein